MNVRRFTAARGWQGGYVPTAGQASAARAAGRETAEGEADAARLRTAHRSLEHQVQGSWQEFHEEFEHAARETPERLAAWVRVLGDAVVAGRIELEKGASSNHLKGLWGAIHQWKEETDPFYVWRHPPEIHDVHEEISAFLPSLIRLAPLDGLSAVDSLPYPALMEEVLLGHLMGDGDLIPDLLRKAPLVFDEDGNWRPERSVSALLVTNLISAHAQTAYNAASYLAQSAQAESDRAAAEQIVSDMTTRDLPEWMSAAFEALLERRDGLHISLAYLGGLCRRKLVGRAHNWGSHRTWNGDEQTLRALLIVLRKQGVGVEEIRETWRSLERAAEKREDTNRQRKRLVRRSSGQRSEASGEGARTLRTDGLPMIYAAALFLGDEATNHSEIECLWAWLDELLNGRDPGLSLVIQGTSLTDIPQHFGFLFSRLPDPDTKLKKLYAGLEPQRRRAQFAHFYEDVHQDLESVILLRIGLNAAANWLDRVKVGPDVERARELFFWIFERARLLWLTAVLDTSESKERLVTSCFAFMPFLFGDALGEALCRTVRPLANTPRLLADACSNLRRNGVGPSMLRTLVTAAGGDIEQALEAARSWAQQTGRDEHFPAHLQELANDLGIRFQDAEDE